MIFFVTCTKTIVIKPFALGPKLEAEIIERQYSFSLAYLAKISSFSRLKTEIEGSLSPTYGYCLFVKTDENKAFLDEGIIDDDGNAVFKVSYNAIYFNLFADEVVDGIVYLVSSVSSPMQVGINVCQNGIRLNVGPIVAFIDQVTKSE